MTKSEAKIITDKLLNIGVYDFSLNCIDQNYLLLLTLMEAFNDCDKDFVIHHNQPSVGVGFLKLYPNITQGKYTRKSYDCLFQISFFYSMNILYCTNPHGNFHIAQLNDYHHTSDSEKSDFLYKCIGLSFKRIWEDLISLDLPNDIVHNIYKVITSGNLTLGNKLLENYINFNHDRILNG